MRGRTITAVRLMMAALLGAATLVLSPPAARAGEGPVVVELYTSQGCSSCPPADAFLAERLADRDDVLALAFHVDYWDYIGWADQFADPAFTKRQKTYARHAGHRTIYTPQMIIGGQDSVVGFRPMDAAELIMVQKAQPKPVRVTLSREGSRARIRAVAQMGLPDGGGLVQFIRYMPRREVMIERGENQGRTLTYANIVTLLEPLGVWDGTSPFEATVEAPGDESMAVIVQARGLGPVFGAAKAP